MRRVLQLAVHAAVVVGSSVDGKFWSRNKDVKIEEESSKQTTKEEKVCDGLDEACSLPSSTAHLAECGVWVAPSSLPGAGLGMYAGKNFQELDLLLYSGDVVIPIVDIMMHQKGRKKFTFLWDEYTWVSFETQLAGWSENELGADSLAER